MVIVIDLKQFSWSKDGMVEGGEYLRAVDVAGMLRDVAAALAKPVTPPPVDPDPVDPDPVDPPDDPDPVDPPTDPVDPPVDPDPVDPPVDPTPVDAWTYTAKAGNPTVPGWYTTLTPSEGDSTAYPHYWNGTQWMWSPDWFPLYAEVDRYAGPIEDPGNILQGASL